MEQKKIQSDGIHQPSPFWSSSRQPLPFSAGGQDTNPLLQVKTAKDNKVVFTVWHGARKHVACLRTIKSLVENMIIGVTKVGLPFLDIGQTGVRIHAVRGGQDTMGADSLELLLVVSPVARPRHLRSHPSPLSRWPARLTLV